MANVNESTGPNRSHGRASFAEAFPPLSRGQVAVQETVQSPVNMSAQRALDSIYIKGNIQVASSVQLSNSIRLGIKCSSVRPVALPAYQYVNVGRFALFVLLVFLCLENGGSVLHPV